MFDAVGWGEMGVLLLLALFVFGPERLPGLAKEAGAFLRKARATLRGMTEDLKTELGPEVGDLDLQSLHPKRIVADLMREDPDPAPVTSFVTPSAATLPVGELAPWDPDTT